MVTGVDYTIEVGSFFLDRFDGAPEDSLPAAAIVGVWMEEANCLFAVSSRSANMES